MQITEIASKVQALGLSDKEARVYVASLFLGPSTVQKIAHQADINRATAYVILEQLSDIGLVSHSTEDKKTVFVAESPEALGRIFDQQIEAVERRRSELKDLLPTLRETQREKSKKAPVVRFYKGSEGVQTMIQETQRKATVKSVGYGMINGDELDKILPHLTQTNPKNRLRKKLASKVFFYSLHRDLPTSTALLREVKRVDIPIMADVSLRGNLASFCTYAGKDSIGIVIDSPEIVGVLRQLFELAWDNQKTVNED